MKLKIERLRDFERDPLNNFLTRSEMMEVVKELIAIRELKGDQVPVDYTDREELAMLREEVQAHADIWLKPYGFGRDIALFAAPQKPVVCLKSGYLHKSEVIDAIEAAGCVVSFSDERLMQDMSDVVKDGK